MNPDPQADLSKEAWRLLGEILESGTCKLKSGKILVFDEDGVLRVVQWLANLQKRHKKLLPQVSDFNLPMTKGGSSGSSKDSK